MRFRAGVLFLLAMFAFTATGMAQSIAVTGIVRDAETKQPLQNVSIYYKAGGVGTRTDSSGRYVFSVNRPGASLEISMIGFATKTVTVRGTSDQEIDIELAHQAKKLDDVVVTNKKKAKYTNKNNPAVELIRHVIENKPKNRQEAFDYASYEKYEKLQVSLSNLSSKFTNNKALKKYHFLFENSDTLKMSAKSLFPVYLEETISNNYYRKSPEKKKVVITAEKKVDYGEFIDTRGVSTYLNRLYEDIDIYDNNISLFTNQFLSPISDLSPTFYMFYIRDTVVVDNEKLIRLYFTPRNPDDLLFRGTMFITLDGNYAVQKLTMTISKRANLNFVRELNITQDFEKTPSGRYHLVKSDMLADFGLSANSKGVFGERTVSFKNFVTDKVIPDSTFSGAQMVTLEGATEKKDSYWSEHRHDSLSNSEAKVYKNIDSLQNMPSFRRVMDIATLLLAGYKSFGKFEVGPASTFYSFNPVEGFRLRFGGRTTPKLSKRLYFETYGAYGFKDDRWKYFLSTTYSLNNKSIYGYPLNFIRASYQHDTKIPGQELQFVQEDNFLLSFKRGNNEKWLYNDIFRLQYVNEFANHLSYTFGYKYWNQQPAGDIYYVDPKGVALDTLHELKTSELSAELRWAPHEQFYQGKVYRIPIINKYPIFTFRYIAGVKGLFGGQYSYHNFNLNIYKRFYVSPLGYTDVTFDGGYILGKVPFPLMDIHHANQTYAYQLNSYNLMNFLEFVSDHYAGVNVDHYFNGFFFNKVPLLKKLKWREVIAGKLLYGGVRDENNPDKNPEAMKYPTTNGVTTTFMLQDNKPYFEGSVGIANIFKLVRIDAIKRFSYLDNPEIPKWGIRFRMKFDF
ncbi:DUF5686 family protein [Chitinophagaceae bacterium LWZ2-11]